MEPEETASDEERRREVRRAYNRVNAQRSRQRTRDKIATLITHVESLEQQGAKLSENQKHLQLQVQRLREENDMLRLSAGLPRRSPVALERASLPFASSGSTAAVNPLSDSAQPATGSLVAGRDPGLSLLQSQASSSLLNVDSGLPSSEATLLLNSSSLPGTSRPFGLQGGPAHVAQLNTLSRHLPVQQFQNLQLPPTVPHVAPRLQQQLLGAFGGATSFTSTEDRLLELQALALLRDQNAARSVPLVNEPASRQTARLLEFLQQRAYDPATAGAQRNEPGSGDERNRTDPRSSP